MLARICMSAVMVDAKKNRRRKWLGLLLIGSAVLVVVGFEIGPIKPFFQRWVDQGDSTIFSLNFGQSDFPSLDRLDSLEWRVIAQRAVRAFAQSDAPLQHIITFLIALLSVALAYFALRTMLDRVAGKKIKKLNGYPNHQADNNAAAARFYFTLGEPAASKEEPVRASAIDPREYELGIDLSTEEFAITATLESEWKL
jgi:hypothetical protein